MKQCLYCQKEMVGRRDKKFCDDQCRNSYNNQQNSDANDLVRQINYTLRKNRRIMEELLPAEGMAKVPAKTLHAAGFDFDYHTHLYTTKAGAVYHYCYEYGYLPIEGDYFLIVKREKKG
jgi:hypothetical protein